MKVLCSSIIQATLKFREPIIQATFKFEIIYYNQC